jgi:hypothetical protein
MWSKVVESGKLNRVQGLKWSRVATDANDLQKSGKPPQKALQDPNLRCFNLLGGTGRSQPEPDG